MRRRVTGHASLLLLATFGWLLASSAYAADAGLPSSSDQKSTTPELVVVDVGLQGTGQLTGLVIGHDGKPVAGETVFIVRGSTVVATCRTNDAGQFAVGQMGGGIYQVRCKETSVACRFWAPGTAPPSAKTSLLLSGDDMVVRGQTDIWPRRGTILKGPAPWIALGVTTVGLIWWDVVAEQRHSFERDHRPAS